MAYTSRYVHIDTILCFVYYVYIPSAMAKKTMFYVGIVYGKEQAE